MPAAGSTQSRSLNTTAATAPSAAFPGGSNLQPRRIASRAFSRNNYGQTKHFAGSRIGLTSSYRFDLVIGSPSSFRGPQF
jgi:hypothetical protein